MPSSKNFQLIVSKSQTTTQSLLAGIAALFNIPYTSKYKDVYHLYMVDKKTKRTKKFGTKKNNITSLSNEDTIQLHVKFPEDVKLIQVSTLHDLNNATFVAAELVSYISWLTDVQLTYNTNFPTHNSMVSTTAFENPDKTFIDPHTSTWDIKYDWCKCKNICDEYICKLKMILFLHDQNQEEHKSIILQDTDTIYKLIQPKQTNYILLMDTFNTISNANTITVFFVFKRHADDIDWLPQGPLHIPIHTTYDSFAKEVFNIYSKTITNKICYKYNIFTNSWNQINTNNFSLYHYDIIGSIHPPQTE